MREIKYRVFLKPEHWDGEKGLMTNGFPLDGFDGWWINLEDPFNECISLDGTWSLKEIEVMEFTGFKDHNGQEIYEGDTLINLEVELEEGIKIEEITQQVYWCEKTGAWMLDESYRQNKSRGSLLSENLNHFKHKVFGNIYEK